MSACSRHHASGFTLIEVLLATALLAAALALGFAVLSAATKTVNHGELLAQRNTQMRAVSTFLRSRIASARTIAFALDPQANTPQLFVGEPDRMRFVADLPDYLGRGGPYLHDLSITDDQRGGKSLVVAFSQVQNSTQIDEAAPRKPEPLAVRLKDASFRYRALDETGVLGDWDEHWTTSDRLPLQVSIRVVPEEGAAWPEIIIALPSANGVPNGGLGPRNL